MNDMRKLMEAVQQLDESLVREGEPIRTTDLSTVKVLGKTEFSMSAEFSGNAEDGEGYAARTLRLEVREYKNNKFTDDGIWVYIIEDGYDGFNLDFKLEDFKRLVNTISALTKRG